jgi:amidase
MARTPDLLLNVGLCLIDQAAPKPLPFKGIYLADDAWAMADASNMNMDSKQIIALNQLVDDCQIIEVADQGLTAWMNAFRNLQGLEIWHAHGQWIKTVNPTFGPGIADRFAWASTLREEDSQTFYALRKEVRMSLSDLLGEDNLLIIPTATGSAPPLKQSGDEMEKRRTRTLQLSSIAGLAGLPQITIPLTNMEGFPIGLSIIAGHHQDIRLLTWVKENAAHIKGGEPL